MVGDRRQRPESSDNVNNGNGVGLPVANDDHRSPSVPSSCTSVGRRTKKTGQRALAVTYARRSCRSRWSFLVRVECVARAHALEFVFSTRRAFSKNVTSRRRRCSAPSGGWCLVDSGWKRLDSAQARQLGRFRTNRRRRNRTKGTQTTSHCYQTRP